MNRGKTALKRGVAVASAAAIAIAGAVLAAPAASASAGATDAVRATPTADAFYVDNTGNLAAFSPTRHYGSGVADAATGTAKVLKAVGNGQAANGLQIAIPSGTAASDVTVVLPTGVSFAGTPNVQLDPTQRDLSSLDIVAGFTSGTNANAATAISPTVTVTAGTLGSITTSAPNTLVINLAKPLPAGAAGTGFILSVGPIALNTNITAKVNTGAITAAVKIGATAVGTTTLGYVPFATVSLASGAASADASGNVALPNITVSETVPDGIGNVATKLDISSSPAGAVADLSPSAKATVSGSTTATVGLTAPAAGDALFTFTPASTDGTKLETYTLSGLNLKSVPKNATVTLTLDGSLVGAVNLNGSAAASAFSYVPGFDGVSASLTTAPPEPRIAGADRYATAALIADRIVALPAATKAWSQNAVVIANGETYKQGVDALAANFLARAEGAPILLTAATSLPGATQTELIKLFKNYAGGDINVYVMGKTDSVSAAVRAQIQAIITSTAALPTANKVNIVSVAGDNRYQTSAAAATTVGASGLTLHSLSTTGAWLRTAFLASGTVNADALAAGSVAGAAGIPVLLTNGTALDSKVSAAIKDLGIQQIIVLGATDRVSAALVTSLSSLGVTSTTRIAGSDRYTTAADLYSWAYTTTSPTAPATVRGLGWGTANDTAYIANGTAGFPDALAVGPLAAAQNNPILTTGVTTLAPAAAKFLTANKADFAANGFWVLGQTDRISSAVVTAIATALS